MGRSVNFTFLILLLITSCSGITSYQTARTFPKKTGRMTLGVTNILTPHNDRPRGISSGRISDIELPLINIGLRTGIDNYMDLAADFNIPYSLGISLKKQFVDTKHFASAFSIGTSYIIVSSYVIPDLNGVEKNYFDFNTSLLLSFDITRNFGINLNLPIVFRKDPFSSEKAFFLSGMILGFRLGDEIGFFVEGGTIWDIAEWKNAASIGLGFYLGNACSAKELHEEYKTNSAEISKIIEGKLLKYLPKNKNIIFTNSAYYFWKEGDRVCVIRNNKKIACGTIYKVKKSFAVAKLNYFFSIPTPNDSVLLENQ